MKIFPTFCLAFVHTTTWVHDPCKHFLDIQPLWVCSILSGAHLRTLIRELPKPSKVLAVKTSKSITKLLLFTTNASTQNSDPTLTSSWEIKHN